MKNLGLMSRQFMRILYLSKTCFVANAEGSRFRSQSKQICQTRLQTCLNISVLEDYLPQLRLIFS